MTIWHEAADLANEAERDITHDALSPTPDQKIALAQVRATLSVAQELSRMINDEGLSVRVDSTPPAEQRGGSA
ncbi:hypothetical protein SAMN06265360_10610 [Haloechinothrix alba]|uniref:Uncharacterized protein n=1 Tax=Haloechinothrix alba TaxID=664784 RepID=A0A238WCE6_9PSEU|nr:hypothetical protein [Haloechinothrix alba]SNR43964.1 hypothetical protein SAMN06265360_10610 [Haloechinothrix alba]